MLPLLSFTLVRKILCFAIKSTDSTLILNIVVLIFQLIVLDRRPVLVDLWASVPSYELEINGVLRTVFATNRVEDLEMFLDFSIPVMNSTEEILNVLHVNSGHLVPLPDRTHANRRFAFIVSS